MRCLALAKELYEKNTEIVFVCRDLPGNICDKIKSYGFTVFLLPFTPEFNTPTDQLNNLSNSIIYEDASSTCEILSSYPLFDWLILDHYSLDQKWEDVVQPIAKRIFVIDDMANRPHNCDAILDQNLHKDMEYRYQNLLKTNCRQFMGPRYALLRSEFKKQRQVFQEKNKTIETLLIMFGGTDPDNETLKVLQALITIENIDIQINVIISEKNQYLNKIRTLIGQIKNACLISNPNNVAELMANADLAIGAGGSSSWERCCVGLPSVLVSMAENQEEVCASLSDAGAAIYIGSTKTTTVSQYKYLIPYLINNPEHVDRMRKRARELVDGRGCERIKKWIYTPDIKLRFAGKNDCIPMFYWRNDINTRKYSHDPTPLNYDKHLAWCNEAIADPKCVILVAEIESLSISIVRFDINNGNAKISLYLVPKYAGQGLGEHVLKSAIKWVKNNYPNINELRAEIKSENIPSLKTFINAGFSEKNRVFVFECADS